MKPRSPTNGYRHYLSAARPAVARFWCGMPDPERSKKMKKIGRYLLIAAISFFLYIFIICQIPIGYHHYQFDLSSGRIREQQWVLGLNIKNEIRETFLSQRVNPIAETPNWVTTSGGESYPPLGPRVYGYYTHGDASARIHRVEILFQIIDFEEEAKTVILTSILPGWSKDKKTEDRFLDEIETYACSLPPAHGKIKRAEVEALKIKEPNQSPQT